MQSLTPIVGRGMPAEGRQEMKKFPIHLKTGEVRNRSFGGIAVEHAIIKQLADDEYTVLVATTDGIPHLIGRHPSYAVATAALVTALDPVITLRGVDGEAMKVFWHAGSLFSMNTLRPLHIAWAAETSPTTTVSDWETSMTVRRADLEALMADCPTGAQQLQRHMEEPYYADHELGFGGAA